MHESKDSTKISWKQQFYQLRVDFTKYFRPQCTETHSVEKRKILSPKNISSNQLFSNLFSKTVTFTKFLLKMREREFRNFHPERLELDFLPQRFSHARVPPRSSKLWKVWKLQIFSVTQILREIKVYKINKIQSP